MLRNGHCHLSRHTRLLAPVLENTGATRSEGKANAFLQTQLRSDPPSCISLKHSKWISSSSHLFYEYSRQIPWFKFQLIHLLAPKFQFPHL